MTYYTINSMDVSSGYFSYLKPIHEVDTQVSWPKKAVNE